MRRRTIIVTALLASGWLLALELRAAQVAPNGARAGSGTPGTLGGELTSGGERLGFANVVVAGTKLGTQTDSAGRFVLEGVPTGRQCILFHAFRYRKLDSLLDVREGENPPIHVELVDLFPPPKCQPCFWVPPFQGTRALRRGAIVCYTGEAWQARVWGRATELSISSDPDPCQLRVDYYLESAHSHVRLAVVDSAGRNVRSFDADGSSGGHHLVWDGIDQVARRTPYGWYHVRLETYGDTLELDFYRVKRPPIR